MATDLKTVDQILKSRLDVVHFEADCISLSMATEVYQRAGQKAVLVRVLVLAEGRLVSIFAPGAFAASGKHAAAVIETLMRSQWLRPLVRYQLDGNDGEVRPIIEIPVMNGELTPEQVLLSLGHLVQTIDWIAPAVTAAASTGLVLGSTEHGDVLLELMSRLALLSVEQQHALLQALDTPEEAA